MKFLILLSLLSSTFAFANNGKIDYCNCYHLDGSGDLVQFLRNGAGQIKGAQIYSTGKEALKYSLIKDATTLNATIAKFYKGPRSGVTIASAEVILIVKNPNNGRERHLIVFRDKKGGLVSISDNWGGNISNCEGTAAGLKSFCAANDGSMVEYVK